MAWSDVALKNYATALNNIRYGFQKVVDATSDFNYKEQDKLNKIEKSHELDEFEKAINNDMNMAVAIGVMHSLPKSAIIFGGLTSNEEIRYMMLKMDEVIGLDLANLKKEDINTKEEVEELPADIEKLKEERVNAREEKNFAESDR
jgi:cysteinyl-tRNA synthetase